MYESTDANVATVAFTVASAEEVEPYYDDLPDDIDRYDEDDDSGSDGKGGSESGSGSRLANTGDPLTGVGPLAMALAAAGAGLAAYSARRTRLENGEIDESEDEE